jgi:hypothetical protein
MNYLQKEALIEGLCLGLVAGIVIGWLIFG